MCEWRREEAETETEAMEAGRSSIRDMPQDLPGRMRQAAGSQSTLYTHAQLPLSTRSAVNMALLAAEPALEPAEACWAAGVHTTHYTLHTHYTHTHARRPQHAWSAAAHANRQRHGSTVPLLAIPCIRTSA